MLYLSVSHKLYNFDKIWFANMHYAVRIDVPQYQILQIQNGGREQCSHIKKNFWDIIKCHTIGLMQNLEMVTRLKQQISEIHDGEEYTFKAGSR